MKNIGDAGELIAIKYLQKHNFEILDTNFKFGRFGEIDIIARKASKYHFIEVKYRTNSKYGSPEEAISTNKLRKCLKTLEFYCKINHISEEYVQFDVITIMKGSEAHKITHYKNIEL